MKVMESDGGVVVMAAKDVVRFSDCGDFIIFDNDSAILEHSEVGIHCYDQCVVKDGDRSGLHC